MVFFFLNRIEQINVIEIKTLTYDRNPNCNRQQALKSNRVFQYTKYLKTLKFLPGAALAH